MRVWSSSLVALPVRTREGRMIARIFRPIFQSETGTVLAFLTTLQNTGRILPVLDIVDFRTSRVLVADKQALADARDIVRVRDALLANIPFFRQRVVTDIGTYLGVVVNIEIDTLGWQMLTLDVRGGWLWARRQHLIPRGAIVRATSDEIVVMDATIPKAARARRVVLPRAVPYAATYVKTPTP